MNPLDLTSLQDGQLVRYRISTRDNAAGTAPEYGEWKTGRLYLMRRTQPLPKRMRRNASHEVGAIILLTIRDTACAEYSQDEYSPEYNEWLAENWRLQFEPLTTTPA